MSQSSSKCKIMFQYDDYFYVINMDKIYCITKIINAFFLFMGELLELHRELTPRVMIPHHKCPCDFLPNKIGLLKLFTRRLECRKILVR